MEVRYEEELLRAAGAAMSGERLRLFDDLTQFVAHRCSAASAARARMREMARREAAATDLQRALHNFVRECWDALDGLGRQVNLCLYDLFPDSGLHPATRMTRQCTFYTVRRALHAGRRSAEHPLSVLLWTETRKDTHPAYARLSFLYNLALFVPVPFARDGSLPGMEDVPVHLRPLLKAQEVNRTGLEEGVEQIGEWLASFVGQVYQKMTHTLREHPTG